MFYKVTVWFFIFFVLFGVSQANEAKQPHEACRSAVNQGSYQKALDTCLQLQVLISAKNDPEIVVHYYFSMIHLYHRLDDDQEAVYLDKVFNHPSYLSDENVKYQYYRTKGRYMKRKGDYQSTIAYYNKALSLALERENLHWMSQSYHNLGIIQRLANNYEAALLNYNKSLEVKYQLADPFLVANAQRNVGVVYTHLEEHDKAVEFYEQAYLGFTDLRDKQNTDPRLKDLITHMYQDLALAYYEVGDRKNSEKFKQLILDHFEELVAVSDQTMALMNVAKLDLNENLYSAAISRLTQAVKMAESYQLEHSSEMYYVLAKAYHAGSQMNVQRKPELSSQFMAAINSAEQGLVFEAKVKNHEVKMNLHQLLSHLYLMVDKESAIEHMQQYQIEREVFLEKKFNHSVKTSQHKLELMLKDKNLIDEKYKNLLKTSEITILRQSRLMFFLLLLCALSVVLFLVITRKKERQKLLSEIKSHQQQLLLLSEKKAGAVKGHSQQFKKQLVETMNMLVNIWERYTGTSRIELAEKSGAWTISIDNGSLRTRSMDKYMSLHSMPKFPRWKNVIKTCHFVLSDEALSHHDRVSINEKLDGIMQIIKERSLK